MVIRLSSHGSKVSSHGDKVSFRGNKVSSHGFRPLLSCDVAEVCFSVIPNCNISAMIMQLLKKLMHVELAEVYSQINNYIMIVQNH